MNKRLKALRKNMNMTQNQFAKCLGITSSLLSQYENDIISIPENVINKICSLFFIDKLWLLYGKVPGTNDYLSQIKKSAIAIIVNLDEGLFNHLVQNLIHFIELHMENNIENKILSYQRELEAEKKGLIYKVLLNINEKNIFSFSSPGRLTWGIFMIINRISHFLFQYFLTCEVVELKSIRMNL
ncbi:helix-turn-helix transcriptional regulator [Anaerocolumna sp. AGMB13020]|uniref:helix-turn-helix domain-containing protein n=1 Tax=Anaerocolumna sp. AGMB13020 TaxID=3081750 RepID=UPI00295444ED|nr:helix-turn-helix transcriptional regulator [Anaerocolumna sp. AGMB13020]WOO35820.1 helix-turn-helix transcriptional regulator [Anaerocolumna sp. AGMB13020]